MMMTTTTMASRNDQEAEQDKQQQDVVAEIQKKLRKDADDKNANGFSNSLLRGVTIRSYSENGNNNIDSNNKAQLIVSFPVTKELSNGFSLHGGAQATATDLFTSVLLYQKYRIPSVTSDLHVSCLAPAPIGCTVVCVCTIERSGAGLQFASCNIYREEKEELEEKRQEDDCSGVVVQTTRTKRILVGKGLHTKYVLSKQRKKGFVGGGGNNSKDEETTTTTTRRSRL